MRSSVSLLFSAVFSFLLLSTTCEAQQNEQSGIHVIASVTPTLTPKIVGVTNLPDGVKLGIEISCPLMYCNEYWSKSFQSVLVKQGSFETPAVTNSGAPLQVGRYAINVVIEFEQDPQVELKMFDLGYNKMGTFAWHFTADINH